MLLTREEAKKLLPLIKAFAEDKTIQYETHGGWIDLDTLNPHVGTLSKYRIKPEPEYRPFKSQEECWQEMLKHQPFGWIIRDFDKEYINIVAVSNNNFNKTLAVSIGPYGDLYIRFEDLFKAYKFADGTPFGIKE